MSADIKSLRLRIKSVDSTLHLTSAMGLVASSKIRKATDAMLKGKEYTAALKEVLSLLAGCEECKKSPYMKKTKGEKTCLLVIAGDRGMAGGYNANVFRLTNKIHAIKIYAVGKRAAERFGKEAVLAENFPFSKAMEFAKEICRAFLSGEIDRFGIVTTEYFSMMKQEAKVEWILPLSDTEGKRAQSAVFEPDEITVLNAMIPDFVAGMIQSCVKESFASEVAARRVAMDNAEKNARGMIEDLELKYNRARQGAITQEITEIVAGSGV